MMTSSNLHLPALSVRPCLPSRQPTTISPNPGLFPLSIIFLQISPDGPIVDNTQTGVPKPGNISSLLALHKFTANRASTAIAASLITLVATAGGCFQLNYHI